MMRFGRMVLAAGCFFFAVFAAGPAVGAMAPSPQKPIKLVFIHHSVGENWLVDANGGLGRRLAQHGYFVSDTNYGWGPDGVGDRTDIPNWPEWFTGPDSKRYLQALYRWGGRNCDYTRETKDPGGENRIILFKSCFPNSNLEGKPGDAPRRRADELSVGNAKAIYLQLLKYFETRKDKLFIAITAPPVHEAVWAANARAFNNWLVNDWLKNYKGTNVAVFDFYNVLTGKNNHHRVSGGRVEHLIGDNRNTLFYYQGGGDNHPTRAGNIKATKEFVPFLNYQVSRWQPGKPPSDPVEAETEAPETAPSPAKTMAAKSPSSFPESDRIDDFETAGDRWEVFRDEANQDTRLSFRLDDNTFLA